MQLLKQRDFSAFFSDTFLFIRENGSHFFINYFTINGVFLLVTFLKSYFIGVGETLPVMIEFLYVLFAFLFGVLNWTFVTIYMIIYSERGLDFNDKDILDYYKQNIGKIIVFLLVTILLMIPIIIVFYIAMLILLITIVGPFLLYAALFIWLALAFYEYLYTDKPIFDSYGYAWKLFTKKFWATTGSTALLYFVVLIIYGVALSLTGLFSSFLEMNSTDALDLAMKLQKGFRQPAVLVVMMFFSVLLVILQVSQGIIYFSQKEQLENISAKDDIDQIGKDEDEIDQLGKIEF